MTAQNKNRLAPNSFIALLVAMLIFPALHDALAVNTGYISDETPAPGSAKDIKSSISSSYSEEK